MAKTGVPILMYHRLYKDPAELAGWSKGVTRYWVSVQEFEREIRALAARGYSTIPLAGLLRGAPAFNGAKPIVLTFDDGWMSDYQHVLPILSHVGFRSEHFVTVGWTGSSPFMSWDQLGELRDGEAGIHSHSMTHPDFGCLAPMKVRDELEKSKAILEDRLCRPVEFLALPGGSGATPALAAAARAIGYRGICTSKVGLNQAGADPYFLRRIPITAGTSPDRLLQWVAGNDLLRLGLIRQTFRATRAILRPRLYGYLKELAQRG